VNTQLLATTHHSNSKQNSLLCFHGKAFISITLQTASMYVSNM